jgi:hypothetical protein
MSTESIGFSIHEAKEPVRIKATSVLEVYTKIWWKLFVMNYRKAMT